MYTLTLHDGTQITGLGLNGTNFISEEQIDESIFTDNLDMLTITDEETGEDLEVLENAELLEQKQQKNGVWWICFREIPQSEQAITNIELALVEIYEMML